MSDPIQDEPDDSFNAAEEPELLAWMKKIQQQLTFLEKKIDALLSQGQPSGQSSEQRPFSRPFRDGRPSRPPFRDGRPSRPFRDDRGPRHSDRPRGFPRSDDSGNRSYGGSGGVRTFDNPHGARRGGGGGGFHSKGKPFFRRKERD